MKGFNMILHIHFLVFWLTRQVVSEGIQAYYVFWPNDTGEK